MNRYAGNATLVIQLSDGTHRTTRWDHPVSLGTALGELEAQQRSRLHQVTRATLFVGQEPPCSLAWVP